MTSLLSTRHASSQPLDFDLTQVGYKGGRHQAGYSRCVPAMIPPTEPPQNSRPLHQAAEPPPRCGNPLGRGGSAAQSGLHHSHPHLVDWSIFAGAQVSDFVTPKAMPATRERTCGSAAYVTVSPSSPHADAYTCEQYSLPHTVAGSSLTLPYVTGTHRNIQISMRSGSQSAKPNAGRSVN